MFIFFLKPLILRFQFLLLPTTTIDCKLNQILMCQPTKNLGQVKPKKSSILGLSRPHNSFKSIDYVSFRTFSLFKNMCFCVRVRGRKLIIIKNKKKSTKLYFKMEKT